MKSEKNKSAGLRIRRFIAGLIFLSVISGLIEDISTGNFSGRSLDDLFFGLIIVFFMAFSSRKKKETKVTENKEFSKKIDSISGSEEDRLEDTEIRINKQSDGFDNTKSDLEELKNENEINKRVSELSYNPVKDRESILARIFKGKTDRV